MNEQRKLAAIMFTDIVGYTALMSKDEEHARQVSQRSRDVIRTQLKAFNGELLDTVGDGTLSNFASVVDAVNCALEIQRTLKDDPELKLRIGIHIGDVVVADDEIYGDGVNVASRLEPLAEPGGICISGQVYRNIRNRPGMEAVFLGEKKLKNVDLPLKVYSLVEHTGPAEEKPAGSRPAGNQKLLYLIIGLLVVGMAYLFYQRRSGQPTSGESSQTETINSIAVLPFVDMSAKKDEEYFCDGLAEELLNSLAQLSGLKVIARTSSFSFKGKNVDIVTIGKKLGVKSVLEGSVRKSGNRVRITAQLIRLPGGVHLWSDTYDRTLDDIFAVQEDISRQVVKALKVTLLGAEDSGLAERPTGNINAYDLYLLGRHSLNEGGWTIESTDRAIDFFRQATELDSSYALAWAGLADAYIRQSRSANVPITETRAMAEQAASRALALDSLLAEAHAAYGWVKDWQHNFTAADAEFHRAIELDPNYMPAYSRYAHLLWAQGRWKDALTFLKQAREIDPLSPELESGIRYSQIKMGRLADKEGIEANLMYGRLDKALRLELKEVEGDPANLQRQVRLSNVYLALGEFGLAEKSLARAKELAPGKIAIEAITTKYFLFLAREHYDRLAEWSREMREKDPSHNLAWFQIEAIADFWAGNPDKALSILERAGLAGVTPADSLHFLGTTPFGVAAYGHAPLVTNANIYLKTGKKDKAEELLARCRSDMQRLREQGLGTPVSYYAEAALHAVAGEKDRALAALREAVDRGWRQSWRAEKDPDLESIRGEPRFKQMMDEVKADIARQKAILKQEGLL